MQKTVTKSPTANPSSRERIRYTSGLRDSGPKSDRILQRRLSSNQHMSVLFNF